MKLIVMDSGAAAPTSTLTRLAFMNRLEPELREIYLRAQSDVDVQIFKDKLLSEASVELTDPIILAGLTMLVSLDVLSSERVQQIVMAPVLESERVSR